MVVPLGALVRRLVRGWVKIFPPNPRTRGGRVVLFDREGNQGQLKIISRAAPGASTGCAGRQTARNPRRRARRRAHRAMYSFQFVSKVGIVEVCRLASAVTSFRSNHGSNETTSKRTRIPRTRSNPLHHLHRRRGRRRGRQHTQMENPPRTLPLSRLARRTNHHRMCREQSLLQPSIGNTKRKERNFIRSALQIKIH